MIHLSQPETLLLLRCMHNPANGPVPMKPLEAITMALSP